MRKFTLKNKIKWKIKIQFHEIPMKFMTLKTLKFLAYLNDDTCLVCNWA